jgi:thymidylate synthase
MSQIDINYHRLLSIIMESGYNYETANRPGVQCRQISSVNIEVTLEKFPLLTTKGMYWKGIVGELIWFLKGDSNIKYLIDNGISIWNKDAYNWYMKNSNQKDLYSIDQFVELIKTTSNKELQKGFEYGDEDYCLGDVGRNYGVQWRDWTGYIDGQGEEHFDQFHNLIENLNKKNPINRRNIVTAWNPLETELTALPPCHWAFEIIPRPLSYTNRIGLTGESDQEHLSNLWDEMIKGNAEAKDKLNKSLINIPKYAFTLKWSQRSVDSFLGLPFNIASYALLAEIIGMLTGMLALEVIANLSNVHVYEPHFEVVKEQLKRSPVEYGGPDVFFSERFIKDIKLFKKNKMSLDCFLNNLQIADFELSGYQSFGPLKAEMLEPTA